MPNLGNKEPVFVRLSKKLPFINSKQQANKFLLVVAAIAFITSLVFWMRLL